ncbi:MULTISPECIES: hypothetical protein [unclassified Sinorhizobium]|uniref:hypothetical protein n=1 Tax=unclassified Sinorhizobium TaxID=2613772 RepID=UPI003523E528
MTAFRFSYIGFSSLALLCTIAAWPFTCGDAVAAPAGDLHQICHQAGEDDTLRGYTPALRDETIRAFKARFPDAKDAPADDELQTQAIFRCMGGRILVCFVGANLPCSKMNAARDNPGADAFCRENPNEDIVPAFATGHDAVYSYRCRNGQAEVTGSSWELDKRGFATKLWTELPDR